MGWIVDNRKGRAMGSRGNKTLIEQAADAVEAAVGKAGPVMADAKEKAAPVLADARDKAAPVLADARDKAMPILVQGAAIAAERAATAADYAAAAAADARDAANAKAAEFQKAAQPKKKHRLRTFLILCGIAAAAGFLVKRLTSRSSGDDWQSSYTPPTGTDATAGTPFEAPPAAAGTTDEAGASPDEALADAVAQGHPATTPEDPAEVVEVEPEGSEQSDRTP